MTDSPEFERNRKRRNWAIFLALLFFIVLVYAITIVKMKAYGP